MMVADASVLVAILAEESDSEAFSERLSALPAGSGRRFVSTVSIWEAACALARIWRIDRISALGELNEFLGVAGIEPVAPDTAITRLAIDAAQRYGMGLGYPGILNLGDCFSYATAKHLGAALLFKGDDFGRTDITPA
jgi:ribonuclease VapC